MSKTFWNSVTESIYNIFENSKEKEIKENQTETEEQNELEFLTACQTGNIDMVNICLSKGINKNNKALMAASRHGHKSIVDLLIHDEENRFTYDATSVGYAIDFASTRGHIIVVEILLPFSCKTNNLNHTISWAKIYGHRAIEDLIIQYVKT
jgi:ankyrin repeat protein